MTMEECLGRLEVANEATHHRLDDMRVSFNARVDDMRAAFISRRRICRPTSALVWMTPTLA